MVIVQEFKQLQKDYLKGIVKRNRRGKPRHKITQHLRYNIWRHKPMKHFYRRKWKGFSYFKPGAIKYNKVKYELLNRNDKLMRTDLRYLNIQRLRTKQTIQRMCGKMRDRQFKRLYRKK